MVSTYEKVKMRMAAKTGPVRGVPLTAPVEELNEPEVNEEALAEELAIRLEEARSTLKTGQKKYPQGPWQDTEMALGQVEQQMTTAPVQAEKLLSSTMQSLWAWIEKADQLAAQRSRDLKHDELLPNLGKQFGTALSEMKKGDNEKEKKEGQNGNMVEDLTSTLHKCLKLSPALEKHFKNTLASPETNIRFDGSAHDAHFDTASCTVILPVNKPPLDLIDGLIFETCNVENRPHFKHLDDEFDKQFEKDSTANVNVADYGTRKGLLESKTVIKHCQLLFDLQEAKAPLAYQSQRNLDKAASTAIKTRLARQQGKNQTDTSSNDKEMLEYIDRLLAVDPQEGLLNPPKRDDKLDAQLRLELQNTLPILGTGKDQELDDAFLNVMLETPHNSRATGTDKNQLPSGALYTYEKVEKLNSKQCLDVILGAFDPSTVGGTKMSLKKGDAVPGDWYNFLDTCPDDPDLVPNMFLRIVQKLKDMDPENQNLAQALDKAAGFTPLMTKIANAPLTEAQAVGKLTAAKGGGIFSQLELLLSPVMRTCLGLNFEEGGIRNIISLRPRADKAQSEIGNWPNSQAKEALLAEVKIEPKEPEAAWAPALGLLETRAKTYKATAITEILVQLRQALDPSASLNARDEPLKELDSAINGIQNGFHKGQLRTFYKQLIEKVM